MTDQKSYEMQKTKNSDSHYRSLRKRISNAPGILALLKARKEVDRTCNLGYITAVEYRTLDTLIHREFRRFDMGDQKSYEIQKKKNSDGHYNYLKKLISNAPDMLALLMVEKEVYRMCNLGYITIPESRTLHALIRKRLGGLWQTIYVEGGGFNEND